MPGQQVKNLRLPHIDLRKVYATSYSLHFHLSLRTLGIDELRELSGEFGGYFLVKRGTPDRRLFYFGQLMRVPDEEALFVSMHVDLTSPFDEDDKSMLFTLDLPKVEPSRLLKAISMVEESFPASVGARFDYPASYATPVLELPLAVMKTRDAPFDEVRGYRAVKLKDDGSVRYSIIVDSRGPASVSHDVAANVLIDPGVPFLGRTFRDVVSISRSFFVEVITE
jgi:hypothetical protein